MNTNAKTQNLIMGATGPWEVIVGLEVHAQVVSQAKLFSGASTGFGAEPNSHVSLVDAAMPGMLPVINAECVKQAVRTGLGLNAAINRVSVFDRKNYFYPDLPQGYQISQYKSPIVGEGQVVVDVTPTEQIVVGIERLHLEQDAGKSVHDRHPAMSCVDLNRSGVALMEIVSKPDLRSADQAKAYVGKLRTIMRYLGTCDGDMEKGSLRADVNVSVRRPGEKLGTRCELKNINSIRFIGQAIDTEARRQIEILEDGGAIDQETRLFDPGRGETRSMRSKEEAHDYRYFPDPDLLPLTVLDADIEFLRAALPELPDAKKHRFIQDFSLSAYDASILIAERWRANYFEQLVANGIASKTAANWLINEVLGRLGDNEISKLVGPVGSEYPIPVAVGATGGVLQMVQDGEISNKIAKQVYDILWREGGDPRAIVEKRGLKQVSDTGAIERVVASIIAANPEKVAQVQAKPTMLGWFVGQVMKQTGGTSNPQVVNTILRAKLGI